MNASFGPGSAPLRGELAVPGDKSLSHRAVLFAAMAEGVSQLTGILDSEDVRSTIGAVSALGACVDLRVAQDGSLAGSVTGWGSRGPGTPDAPIDCGNSGTTTRLLLGMLAAWPVTATLVGDASLSRRPMLRVISPLERMGATFSYAEGGTLPVTVKGTGSPLALDYDSPVASAQVKTAILLAGTRAKGMTRVVEPSLSRDHTERLLPAFGVQVDVDQQACSATVTGPAVPVAFDVDVPRDPSSAAFPVAAALLIPGSEISLPGVSLNPTRVGFLRVLERMGADIEVRDRVVAGAEPSGTIVARYSAALRSTVVRPDEVPSLVDEVPVLALVAAHAEGTTRFEGVGELRVKESDRLAAIVDGLSALGADVHAEGDTLLVSGPSVTGSATLDSLGDHRLAMTWALAGLSGSGEVTVTRFEAVSVSYPGFADDLAGLGA